MSAALLSLSGVTLYRGGRILLEDFSLRLMPGEAAILTGPNGAGKSSLIRLAAGLLRPAVGTASRAEAALADENLALDAKQTLGAALHFWARFGGGGLANAMSAMGVDHLADVPVRMLSTGQRKRAALARTIASAAPLWLLDEPGNGLDTDGLERLTSAAQRHLADGGAILAATHQPLGLTNAREVRIA